MMLLLLCRTVRTELTPPPEIYSVFFPSNDCVDSVDVGVHHLSMSMSDDDRYLMSFVRSLTDSLPPFITDVQYVIRMMPKCLMVKVGEDRRRRNINRETFILGGTTCMGKYGLGVMDPTAFNRLHASFFCSSSLSHLHGCI